MVVRCLLAHSNQTLFKHISSLARNYEKLVLNIIKQFHSNSELHAMAINVIAFCNLYDRKHKEKIQICLCTFHGNLFEFLDLPVKSLRDSQFENKLQSYFCHHPNIWLSLEQLDIDFVLK